MSYYLPEIMDSIKENALLSYTDEWIEFKIKLLQGVHYFNHPSLGRRFFSEVQYFMHEKTYNKDTYIYEAGKPCDDIIFIVNGQIDIQVKNISGDKKLLESLLQGSNIFQYAVHSRLPPFISAKAATCVRVLTLSRQFFQDLGLKGSEVAQDIQIDGLEESIVRAQNQLLSIYKQYKQISENRKTTFIYP